MRIRTTVPFWAVAAVLFCFNLSTASAQDYWEDEQSYDEPSQDGDQSPEDSTDEEGPYDAPEDDTSSEDDSDPEGSPEAEEILEKYRTDGRRVYLVCIFGDRDHGIVTRKCRDMEQQLDRAYGARWVKRLNNPSEAVLEAIQRRVGHDIAAVIIVTHSTPDSDEESGYDVWDCPLGPDEIADIFEDEWVIWNGCFSRGICELADNILPTQCEDGILDSSDDTWREIMRCLERNQNTPRDRDEICEQVFGEGWDPEDE
jgi:hypothetical protein